MRSLLWYNHHNDIHALVCVREEWSLQVVSVQVTTVRETDEIPSNLRVHPCHWSDCHTSCETPESLHRHILSLHATVYVNLNIF